MGNQSIKFSAYSTPARVEGPIAAYVCRGCGTEIFNKGAFKKCPVCGIHFG